MPVPLPQDVVRAQTARKLPLWEAQGRRLVDAFLDAFPAVVDRLRALRAG